MLRFFGLGFGSSSSKPKVKEHPKTVIVKHHEGLEVLMGLTNGQVLEFSMIGDAKFNFVGSRSSFPVNSIARSGNIDNKSVLCSDPKGRFWELNLSNSNYINNYPITGQRWKPGKSARKFVKTHDQKFLITAPWEKKHPLDIYSTETFE